MKRSFFYHACLILTLLTGPALAESFDELLKKGENYRQTQQYHLAIDTLKAAQREAQTPEQKARAEGALGHTYYFTYRTEAAESGLRVASQSEDLLPVERANYANLLASLYAGQKQTEQAARIYQQALDLAGDNRILALSIRLNQIRLLPEAERLALLTTLAAEMATLPESPEQARLYLYLGEQARTLGANALPLCFQSLDQARQIATRLKQEPLLIEILGSLGHLYEQQNRDDEALRLTQEALRLAQTGPAHDLLINLEWQQGRLLKKRQQTKTAREAYQRAVEHIEAIRLDIPVQYHDGRSSFRETLAPLYLGLADLLLLEARQQPDTDLRPLLHQARDAVELLKQSELEDFLGDRCLIATARSGGIQQVAADTAVLYPVILPDRLELLLDLKGTIHQFTVPVTARELERTARTLASQLRNQLPRFRPPAEQLYHWLIAPIDQRLREAGVRTLVTIPDGALRLIPMAALHDGQQYLFERYSLATSPALSILAGAHGGTLQTTSLLAGLSEPGAVVEKLPWELLRGIIGSDIEDRALTTPAPPSTNTRSLVDRLRGTPLLTETRSQTERELLRTPEVHEKIKEALSLPGVKQEIDQLRGEMANILLFNESFTVERFKQQLSGRSFPIIHIASHGVFGHNAETTFIMAYDDVIRIDTLESLLKTSAQKKAPVELLTLSACQTAEGDDRAPLGLSGVALRAHARSAIGTLWPISDDAAFTLMSSFYRYLKEPGTGKSQALRRAQLELLKNEELNHPYFWSPFILVGNWS